MFDSPSLYTFCIPCFSQVVKLSGQFSLYQLNTIWSSMNRNLHRKPVLIGQSRQKGSIFDNTCPPSNFVNLQRHTDCIVTVIRNRLNFTNVYLPHPPWSVHGYISLGIVNQKAVVDSYILFRTADRYELLSYGEEIYFYNFLIVTKKHAILDGLESLISPFDKFTWILIISSCTGIMVMFQLQPSSLSKGLNRLQLLKNISASYFWSVTSIMGQCGTSPVKQISSKISLLGCWAFFCFFLNNFYQGSDLLGTNDRKFTPRSGNDGRTE